MESVLRSAVDWGAARAASALLVWPVMRSGWWLHCATPHSRAQSGQLTADAPDRRGGGGRGGQVRTGGGFELQDYQICAVPGLRRIDKSLKKQTYNMWMIASVH